MKKMCFIFAFMIVLFANFALAEISISEPLDTYNLGDRLYVSVGGLVGTSSGNLNINLVCGNQTISLVKIPSITFSADKQQDYSIPYKILSTEDLEITNVNQILGNCQVTALLGSSTASTKTFAISNEINVEVSLDKMLYNPGEQIMVDVKAYKINGKPLSGFVEASNATSFNKAIENGLVSETFSMPKTAEAGEYALTVRAYDTGSDGVLNEGTTIIYFTINQVPTSMVTSLSILEVSPGSELKIGAEIFDQSGIEMDGTVSVRITSPEGNTIESSVQCNDFTSINFPLNATAGAWQVTTSFGDLVEVKEFEVIGIQKVEFYIEDSVLVVKNIGNTIYNKSIQVNIGAEVMQLLDLKIGIGEIRKFNLKAPNGQYDVVVGDGESTFTGSVLLTGNAISVSSFRDVGIFKGYSIIWIFFIVVFGGIGLILVLRYRRTRRIGDDDLIDKISNNVKRSVDNVKQGVDNVTSGVNHVTNKVSRKVPTGFKSHVGDTLTFTNKSPAVQSLDESSYSHEDKTMIDFTKRSMVGAESVLVLKGKKYVSSVVAVSIKNNSKLGKAAKESLKQAFSGVDKKKGLIDWKDDCVFVIFSPLVTKTYNNEILAVDSGLEILKSLTDYNKKFRDKIQFNIGVNIGELVAAREGSKLKYNSVGNAVSLAKKIGDSDSGKLLVSDGIRRKLMRDLKVIKAKDIGNNPVFEVEDIKNKVEAQAKLNDLLKRTSNK